MGRKKSKERGGSDGDGGGSASEEVLDLRRVVKEVNAKDREEPPERREGERFPELTLDGPVPACCCCGPSLSFSGAASNTLKCFSPFGPTSRILAMLPQR